jgi:hypothetical protein
MQVNSILSRKSSVQNRSNRETRMRNYSVFVGIALLALVNASALAEDSEDSIKIRPQAGIGSLDGDKSYHAGVRLLLKASEDKKYGMELTRMFTSNVEYIVAGVILEQKKFGWLNLSIGSVGYFGQSRATPNVPGLLLNVGWEPETTCALKPFVSVRYDNIFAEKLIAGTAISAGLSAIF